MLATVRVSFCIDLELAVGRQRALQEQLHRGLSAAASPSSRRRAARAARPRTSARRGSAARSGSRRGPGSAARARAARRPAPRPASRCSKLSIDEQQLALAQVSRPGRRRSGPSALVALRQRARDLGRDQRRVGQLLEPHEHGTVRVTLAPDAGASSSSSRVLPTPPGPVSVISRTSGSAISPAKRAQLALAPDEPRQRPREVRGADAPAAAVAAAPGAGACEQQHRVALEDLLLQAARAARPAPDQARSANRRRARWNASSASAWRPARYSASISWPHSRSSNGCSRDQPLELGDQLARRAGREVGVDPQHDRLQALLLERPAPLRDASLAGHVAERFAAEQRQRLGAAALRPSSGSARACSTSASKRHTSSSKPPGWSA